MSLCSSKDQHVKIAYQLASEVLAAELSAPFRDVQVNDQIHVTKKWVLPKYSVILGIKI